MASTPFRGTLTHRFIEHRASSQAPSPQLGSPQKHLSQSHPSPPPPTHRGGTPGRRRPAQRQGRRGAAQRPLRSVSSARPAGGSRGPTDGLRLGRPRLRRAGGLGGHHRLRPGRWGRAGGAVFVHLVVYLCVCSGRGPANGFLLPSPKAASRLWPPGSSSVVWRGWGPTSRPKTQRISGFLSVGALCVSVPGMPGSGASSSAFSSAFFFYLCRCCKWRQGLLHVAGGVCVRFVGSETSLPLEAGNSVRNTSLCCQA